MRTQDNTRNPEVLLHPVRIGNVEIPGNLFLAPVAGFSDSPFRSICIENGADLVFTEMVSCEGLSRDSQKTINLTHKQKNQQLLAVQVFAPDPVTAVRGVKQLSSQKPDLIDLNCGCPVPKIIRTGCGSALMKTPEMIGKIVHAIKQETDAPVTVKIRSGWDASSITYLQAAKSAEEAGAAMVSIHARTRAQGYSGKADHEHTRILKSRLSIPVTASGDLFSPEDAERIFKQTGCDAVMFARGAVGNPFIFRKTKEYLETGTYTNESHEAKLRTALRQLEMMAEITSELRACKEMRKHMCAYTKGLQGGAALRQKVVHAETIQEYNALITDFLNSL
ncbi:MAG: tRNA dihydrouridine synthase DusB [Spirochaetia bacterium]